MKYIKENIDFLKLEVKGSLNYVYQTMIIKAVQTPAMVMIIIILVMMTRMIDYTEDADRVNAVVGID